MATAASVGGGFEGVSSRLARAASELGLPHGKWDVPSNVRVVREAAAIFGADRIVFGSNLPVSTLTTDFPGIVAVMREALAQETPETLAKFFAHNAIRFYRMPIQLP